MKLSELLDQIELEIRQLPSEPNALSDALIRLAAYYTTLSPFVTEAWRKSEAAKVDLKVTQERKKLKAMGPEGKTAAAAESIKIVETEEAAKELVDLTYKHKLLQAARENLEATIDVGRSKLTTARTDQRNAREM